MILSAFSVAAALSCESLRSTCISLLSHLIRRRWQRTCRILEFPRQQPLNLILSVLLSSIYHVKLRAGGRPGRRCVLFPWKQSLVLYTPIRCVRSLPATLDAKCFKILATTSVRLRLNNLPLNCFEPVSIVHRCY